MNKEPRFNGKTTQQRSHTMSRIRGKNTSIEIKLQKALWNEGIHYRKQYRISSLKRRTIDIAITKHKVAIFCDSEFFHGKDWKTLREKLSRGSNPDYWLSKIQHNIERDEETNNILQGEGWIVLRFWQKDIDKDIDGCITTVKSAIVQQELWRSPTMETYDRTNPKSIERYGKLLEGKTFRQFVQDPRKENFHSYNADQKVKEATFAYKVNRTNKGSPGTWVEQYWFGYKPNSDSRADFYEAGVELKVSPFKKTSKGYSAKERLVITIINYMKDADKVFEESHLLEKLNLILLIYYLWKPDADPLDYKIKYVQLLQIPEEDMPTIRRDYDLILDKINTGRAHELSEADTLYLGACTKGKNASSKRQQPYSDIPAMQRAFCLKTSYMTYLLNNWIIPGKMKYEPIIKDKTNLPLEQYVVEAIEKYRGWTLDELCQHFKMKKTSKNCTSLIAFKILGIKGNQAVEFIKAGIQVKTIRLTHSGRVKESMSFPKFNFKSLAAEDWEDDPFAEALRTTKYLFVVYRFGPDQKTLYLNGCQFWNMPIADIDTHVYNVWKNTKQVLNDGTCMVGEGENKKYNFPKIADDPVCHVRPHARDSSDTEELPDGRQCPKQCFWLNARYIQSQLRDEVAALPYEFRL